MDFFSTLRTTPRAPKGGPGTAGKPPKPTNQATPGSNAGLPGTVQKDARPQVKLPFGPLSEKDGDANSPTRAPSVCSDQREEDIDSNNDTVKVLVRVRPPTELELNAHGGKHEECVEVKGARQIHLLDKDKVREPFTFDQVLHQGTTQQDVFEMAGQSAVDNCIAGYSTSIFAYGQTGSGKTFTVTGQLSDAEKRGLAPRMFDYLYEKITEEENSKDVKFNVRCSYLEIYNESISDLLRQEFKETSSLAIREDIDGGRGTYVEGLLEPNVLNAEEMLGHLLRGTENRRTGETRLNKESSRSHSVFTCTVEKTVKDGGTNRICVAKINLIDLAGSERIGSGAHGGSNVVGERHKETCAINLSLTALGRVTMELLSAQKAKRSSNATHHIPYRDSKLTFLLQGSLGGDAKTLIIANISPSSICAHETLSTLRFVQQTKKIKNEARIKWTVQGDRAAMQREIERLRAENMSLKSGHLDPLIQENEELAKQLDSEREQREQLAQERNMLANDFKQAKRERDRLERMMTGASSEREELHHSVVVLQDAYVRVEAAAEADRAHASDVLEAYEALALENARVDAQLQQLLQDKQQSDEAAATLAGQHAALAHELDATKAKLADGKAELQRAELEENKLRDQLQATASSLKAEQASKLQAQQDATAAAAAVSMLQDTVCAHEQAAAEQSLRHADVQRQLEDASSERDQLQQRLAQVEQDLAAEHKASSSMRAELTERSEQLTSQHRLTEAADTTVVSLRQQLAGLEEQLAAERAGRADLELRHAAIGCSLQAEITAKANVEHSHAELASQAAELREQLVAMKAAQEALTGDSAAAHQQLTEQLAQRAAEVAATQRHLAASEAECAERAKKLEAQAHLHSQAQAESAARLQAAEAANAELRATNDGLQGRLAELGTQNGVAQGKIADNAAAIQARDEQLKQLRQELDAMAAAKEALDAVNSDQASSLTDLQQRLKQEASTRESQVADLESEKSSLLSAIDEQQAQLSVKSKDTEDMRTQLQAQLAAKDAQLAEQQAAQQALLAAKEKELEEQQALLHARAKEVAALQHDNAQLSDKLQKEKDKFSNAAQDASDKAVTLQRRLTDVEEKHRNEVQDFKDQLSAVNKELQQKNTDLVKANYSHTRAIDNLTEKLQQKDKEISAVHATAAEDQEKLERAFKRELATLEDRVRTVTNQYNKLSEKYDKLEMERDTLALEAQYWRSKQERLDGAMGEVMRLIDFARHPPDSARSSLIMTRSDHKSAGPAVSARLGSIMSSRGPPPLRVSSPMVSPKGSARYGGSAAASPATSKAGSTRASRLIEDGSLRGAGEDWEVSSRRQQDIASPGDQQLAVPSLDADV